MGRKIRSLFLLLRPVSLQVVLITVLNGPFLHEDFSFLCCRNEPPCPLGAAFYQFFNLKKPNPLEVMSYLNVEDSIQLCVNKLCNYMYLRGSLSQLEWVAI